MNKKLLIGLAPLVVTAAFAMIPAVALAAAPTVTSITPTNGAQLGGTAVTLKGTEFLAGATVTIKGCVATGVVVVSLTEITAKTVVCGAGPGNVAVKDTAGTSGVGPTYTYTPWVLSVTPESGPFTGGTAVTIKGLGFLPGATVTIGSAATGVVVVNETEITAKTGAVPGPAADQVIVKDANGTSAKGAFFKFNCAAPACPHTYVNGVKAVAGEKVRTIGWGNIVLKNAFLTEVECHNVVGGFSENPVGGGASVGQVQAFDAYECVSAGCTALGGSAIEVIPENLPWSGEATEPVLKVFRGRAGKPPKTPKVTEAGEVIVRINCVNVTNTQFYGENSPKTLNNGLAIGSLPGEVEFDQPGSGELENENIGAGITEGTVKGEGYGEEELISVKNP
jgi:hypothetical protein